MRAFVPSPLPPSPSLEIGGPRQLLLERATLAVGRLDSISTLLPDPHLFLYSYVRREAVLSSQIEGTQSSLSDSTPSSMGTAVSGGFSSRCSSTMGGLAQPLLYLSLYLKQHRSVYYDLLDRVRTTGDWEAWVDFFLEGVEETARGAVQTARRLVDLFETDTRRVQETGRTASNTLRVLNALRNRPVLTLNHLRDVHGMTFPTAAKSMNSLVTLGIARELTGQRRNRVFVYDSYLNILNKGGQPL